MNSTSSLQSDTEIPPLKERAEFIMNMATEVFKGDKELAPTVFLELIGDNGKLILVPMTAAPFMKNEVTKLKLRQLLKEISKSKGVECLCVGIHLVAESWVARSSENQTVEQALVEVEALRKIHGQSFARWPRALKKEAIVCMSNAPGRSVSICREINEDRSLAEMTEVLDSVSGNFTHLFEDPD